MNDAGSGNGHDALGRHLRSLNGREIPFDREGFFWEFEDWSPAVALILARESGLDDLGDAHWNVLNFLREYYQQNGRAPLNRQLKQGMGMSLLELQGLFPEGLKQGARRLAGLPNPKTCG